MFDFLAGLNPEQRAAATFEAPVPLRILAGAGTGKTTALASRVAWLLASGTPPERVLLLTFTRRAARQLLARTETMLAKVPTPTATALVASRAAPSTRWPTARCAATHPGSACPTGSRCSTPPMQPISFDLVRDQHLGTSTAAPPVAPQGDCCSTCTHER